MKPIEFSNHALAQMEFRGVIKEEVIGAIQDETWVPARAGRNESRKVYPFGKTWKDEHYDWKTVNPVFVEEQDKIVVVTVYAFYGKG